MAIKKFSIRKCYVKLAHEELIHKGGHGVLNLKKSQRFLYLSGIYFFYVLTTYWLKPFGY